MTSLCCCSDDDVGPDGLQRSVSERVNSVHSLDSEDHSAELAGILEEALQPLPRTVDEQLSQLSRLSPLERMDLRPTLALGPGRAAAIDSLCRSSIAVVQVELEMLSDDAASPAAAAGAAVDRQDDVACLPSVAAACQPLRDVFVKDATSSPDAPGGVISKDNGSTCRPRPPPVQTDTQVSVLVNEAVQVDVVVKPEGDELGPDNKGCRRIVRFLALGCARLAMFMAWWLGARRLHRRSAFDGDADVHDVNLFLRSPSAAMSPHFRRVQTPSRSFSNLNFELPGTPSPRPTTPNSSGQLQPPASSKPPTELIADVSERTSSGPRSSRIVKYIDEHFGNGDGELDASDFFESGVETGQEVEEEFIQERFHTGQARPVFVAFEVLLTLGLWFVLAWRQAAQGSEDHFLTTQAGLGTLFEDSVDLRIHRDCQDLRPQVWRWLAYQFTHVGLAHAGLNAAFIVFLGVPLEGLHGSCRVAAMYNCGVFGGACCFFVLSPHASVVGASGGCYAFLGMHVADLVMNWKNKRFRKPTVLILAALAVFDLAQALSSRGPNSVNHATHFGGFVAGLFIGIILGHNFYLERWERQAQWFVSMLAFGLSCFCIAWLAAAWPPRSLGEDVGWCWLRQIFNRTLLGVEQWQCVKCVSPGCIGTWGLPNQQHVLLVEWAGCDELGWAFIDGS